MARLGRQFPIQPKFIRSSVSLVVSGLGLTSETDTALPMTFLITAPIGLATEIDTALPFSFSLIAGLGETEETDEALSISWFDTVAWPFDDLQPRDIGIYPVAGTIGGGISLTEKEPAIDSGNGYWKIYYGQIPIRNRTKILRWREYEALLEGRGHEIVIPLYDGKRAPWVGAPGGPIDIVCFADAATADTTLQIQVNSAGTLSRGMHFSAVDRAYRIKSVTDLGGGIFQLSIWPKLRAPILAGDPLEFRRPVVRVRLSEDGGMTLTLEQLRHGYADITFEET